MKSWASEAAFLVDLCENRLVTWDVVLGRDAAAPMHALVEESARYRATPRILKSIPLKPHVPRPVLANRRSAAAATVIALDEESLLAHFEDAPKEAEWRRGVHRSEHGFRHELADCVSATRRHQPGSGLKGVADSRDGGLNIARWPADGGRSPRKLSQGPLQFVLSTVRCPRESLEEQGSRTCKPKEADRGYEAGRIAA